MKLTRIKTLLAALFIASYAFSGVTLTVGDYTGSPGGTSVNVELKLSNTEALSQLVFDIVFKDTGDKIVLDGDVDFNGATGAVVLSDFAAGATPNVVEREDKNGVTISVFNFGGAAFAVSETERVFATIKLLVQNGAEKKIGPLKFFPDSIQSTGFVDLIPSTVVDNGTLEVVYKFNAFPVAKEFSWDAENTYTVPAADFIYTNEAGALVDGTIISLGTPTIDDEAMTADWGSVQLDNGSIVFTAGTRSVVKHTEYTVKVPFTAAAAEGGYTDSSVYSLTVKPVNQAPVAEIIGVSQKKEGEKLVFTARFTDPEGDVITPGAVLFTTFKNAAEDVCLSQNVGSSWANADDETAQSNFASGETALFTSSSEIPFDAVKHDNDYKTSAPWKLNLTASDSLNKSGNFEIKYNDSEELFSDFDRPAAAPTVSGFSPANVYTSSPVSVSYSIDRSADNTPDPDVEDNANNSETFKWEKMAAGGTAFETIAGQSSSSIPAGLVKKGDTLKVTVSIPNFDGSVSSASTDVIVSNSLPTVADNTLFIQKLDTPLVPTAGSVAPVGTDADGADDIESYAATLPLPAKFASVVYNTETKVFDVTLADTTEEFVESFTYTATDKSGGVSEAATITVTYKKDPQPVLSDDSISEPTDGVYPEVDAEGQPTVIKATITAADSNIIEGAPASSGIASFEWNLKDAGGALVSEGFVVSQEPALPTSGTESSVATFTLTLGYDFLKGVDRPATLGYTLTVTAKDGNGAVSAPFTWNFTVKDVDRAPTAPTAFALPEDQKAGVAIAIATAADGSADEDEDVIAGYDYDWSYSTDGTNFTAIDGMSNTNATSLEYGEATRNILKKGNTIKVAAKAYTKPYGSDVKVYSAVKEDTLTIINTKPVITLADGAEWTVEENSTAETPANTQTLAFEPSVTTIPVPGRRASDLLTVKDIDVDGNVDTLKFKVSEIDHDGTITPVAAGYTLELTDGKLALTFVPKQYTNEDNTETAPSFVIQAFDGEEESEPVVVSIKVTPVNDAPIVEKKDVYIVPAMCDGTTLHTHTITVNMGGGADENEQTITAQTIAVTSDADGIFQGVPTIAADNSTDPRTLTISYTISAEAADKMGKEAVVTVTVTDSGEPNKTSEAVEIKFILGATPWYPIYNVPCTVAEHKYHEVTLNCAGETVKLIVDGDTLYPTHYYYQGNKGLASGEDYAVEVRVWDPATGASSELCNDPEAAESTLTVPVYELPGEPSMSMTSNENSYSFEIATPLSSKFEMVLYKDGAEYKTIAKDYVPNEDGLILPATTVTVDLFEEGLYYISLKGINPNGAGEVKVFDAADEKFQVGGAPEVLEWPADGVFTPSSKVIYLTDDKNSVEVNFSWPIVSAAASYVLCIEKQMEGFYADYEVASNSKSVVLNVKGDSANVNWWVVAVDAKGNEVNSGSNMFEIVRTSEMRVVDKVSLVPGTTTLELNYISDGIAPTMVDVQLAHFSGRKAVWYNFLVSKGEGIPVVDGVLDLGAINSRVQISAGDAVYIRYWNGNNKGDYKLYTIK